MLTTMDVGVLILRIVVGLLFVGHGTQKLLGWFGGKGLAGHTARMDRLGIHPARFWAWVNALGEFLGGLAFTIGLLTPLAAAALIGSMLVAIAKVHWPKGLWNANGGVEWPLVLATVAFVVGLTGPGLYSLDHALGVVLPEPATYLAALVAMLIVAGAALIPNRAVQREHRAA